MQLKNKKVILSLAGLDPSSGAGVFSDIKTISSLGLYGMAIPTCLTVQDNSALYRIEKINVNYVIDSLDKIFDLYDVSGIKIGLINDYDLIDAVSSFFEKENPNLCFLIQ